MDGYIEQFFPSIERVIAGYDCENKTYNSRSVSIENYPKVLTLCSASVFEKTIKDRVRLFLKHPASPISSTYPQIARMSHKNSKPLEDTIFGKFVASNRSGVENLDATRFYDLFGGMSFKILVETKFIELRDRQKMHADDQAKKMADLIKTGYRQNEESYSILIDMVDQLDRCTFDRAESAYLNIKLRRNQVAHDYMTDLLDSFNDLRVFYYGASLYIVAVYEALSELIDSSVR